MNRLYCACPKCGKEIMITRFGPDNRFDLSMQKGHEFPINCQACGEQSQVHVDDVYTILNSRLIFVVLILCVIGGTWLTLYVWDLGFIASLTVAIPMGVYYAISTHLKQKVVLFNETRIGKKKKTA